jgi:hypothetical protein
VTVFCALCGFSVFSSRLPKRLQRGEDVGDLGFAFCALPSEDGGEGGGIGSVHGEEVADGEDLLRRADGQAGEKDEG